MSSRDNTLAGTRIFQKMRTTVRAVAIGNSLNGHNKSGAQAALPSHRNFSGHSDVVAGAIVFAKTDAIFEHAVRSQIARNASSCENQDASGNAASMTIQVRKVRPKRSEA